MGDRRRRARIAIAVLVTVLVSATVVILYWDGGLGFQSGGGGNDRPPIIVRDGSIIFDGGEPSRSKPWSRDTFLGEWKPDHPDGPPVKEFRVTFAGMTPPAGCSSPLTGAAVLVDYSIADGNGSRVDATFNVHIRKKNLFGKPEPKIDPAGASLAQLPASSAPPAIFYGQTVAGWISRVEVGGTPCAFGQPNAEERKNFRVRIQPVTAP